MQLPKVSVVIPVYNEGKYISRCIECMLSQDYPKSELEILIVDGRSKDNTRKIINEYIKKYSFIYLLDNPGRITSKAMNIGIENAKGEIIVRMDGHAEPPADYISKCIDKMLLGKADVVCSLVETAAETFWQHSIAVGISSRFGVGSSLYRVSSKEVYDEIGWMGVFWRKQLIAWGGYDENFDCNEDDEFFYRIQKNGAKLYISPDIHCKYYCRKSLKALWKQYYRFGFEKVSVIQKLGSVPKLRHIVPACFVSSLFGSLLMAVFIPFFYKIFLLIAGLYIFFIFIASTYLATKNKNIRYFFSLPLVFFTLHLSYGTGFLFNTIIKLKKKLKKAIYQSQEIKNDKRTVVNTDNRGLEALKQHNLLVFDDQIFAKNSSNYYGTETHILYLLGLQKYFKSMQFFARTQDSETPAEEYKIPNEISIHPIPYYNNLISFMAKSILLMPRIYFIFRKYRKSGDYLYLAWPHPLSLFLYIITKLSFTKVHCIFVARQNLGKLVRLRYKGMQRALAVGVVGFLETSLRWFGRNQKIFTVGDEVQQLYKKSHPNTHLIYCPIITVKDIEYTISKTHHKTFDLLFVGRLEPEKGLQYLLQAVAMVSKKIPVHLDMIGDGIVLDDLKKLAIELDIVENITWHGYFPFGEKLFEKYKQADVFVMPSLSEGLPNVIFETMGLGLPLISTNVGGIPTIIIHGKNGWLVPPADAQAIADAIITLSSDKHIYNTIKENLQHVSKQYTREYQQQHFAELASI